MASGKEWPPRVGAESWPVAVPKVENDWHPTLPKTNSLSRAYTLKSRVEVGRLLDSGRRETGKDFTLVWERSERFEYGVFVRGKAGTAVERNRLKRLYREAIRLNRAKLKQQIRVAILHRSQAGKPGFDSINAEISRIFARIDHAG